MKLIKNKIATLSLPIFVLFSQATLANISPYIGYENGFTHENILGEKNIFRYTPRVYMGIQPIYFKGYDFGIETGYFFPYSFKYKYINTFYDFEKEFSLKRHRFDLSLMAHKSLGDHVHWFLKPGVEFLLNSTNGHIYTLYHPVIKTGIGYTFNNKIGVNFITGSRLSALNNSNRKGNMLFTFDVHYTW